MKKAWVIGEGGIGHALHQALLDAHYDVTVLSRKHGHDLLSQEVIKNVLQTEHTLPSLVINTCGLLHDKNHQPEKALQTLTVPWLMQSIEANVLITMNLAQVLSQHLSPRDTLQFCAFSARVSSISDNAKGGWYSYRMSKAMLNMLIKNIAIEWHAKFASSTIFAYHPGTVDTPLSRPFRAYIPDAQLFSPEEAARYCLKVLFNTTLDKHGKLIDWQGREIMP